MPSEIPSEALVSGSDHFSLKVQTKQLLEKGVLIHREAKSNQVSSGPAMTTYGSLDPINKKSSFYFC
jgi:hypothetical protein